ncbi:uncharacterized protein LOC119726178 [Patiria miniata]|uniref:Integrase catalytic domain-containing protein n=1 Tax=Patiria miniata TaxID=46514 RepID=A0A913ZRG0_PATMI|nr:uncharacterized protein LOC119726178 [Patiria miniata]
MRNMYKILASQYDPIGYLTPFTARARVIVQDLWKTKRNWDDPLEPGDIRDQWQAWESELPHLTGRVYGAVAYIRTEDEDHNVHVSFIIARSRVAPKRQLSMPRLELSVALAGAQLADLVQKELTLPLDEVILWSDSTTVLTWLQSESCRYKVFVGTRVAEIQTLTDVDKWRYVDTKNNPTDDLTRGKTLVDLSQANRWRDGPSFLRSSPDTWPAHPSTQTEDPSEFKKSTFCGAVVVIQPNLPDPSEHDTWSDLVAATMQHLHGAAEDADPTKLVEQRVEAEMFLYQRAQQDSFPEEIACIQAGKELPRGSRLLQLAPEYDESCGLIRVGGRLRRTQDLPKDTKHPIVMNPAHPITKLIIRDYDEKLLHYGPERILAEIRRKFWILRGREAIRKHQRQCFECQKWRASPQVPKMGDLPPARLRLFKPPFYSTGVDCFGPMTCKIGRRSEKRWGIIFKCMTTRAIHLDLLDSLDTDAFLMAFRRFISRRGKPFEILCDCGTNFKGGDNELRDAFAAMDPILQQELAKHQVKFEKDQVHPDPVTPNLLLMGRHDATLPQVVYPARDLLGRRRWKHSQVLADHFWSGFVKSYLPTLQERQKWRTDRPNLTTNDVVMIVDPALSRAQWPIGRVAETFPGSDGRVRTASVSVRGKTYTRPVARLIRLPEVSDDNLPDGEPDNT